MKPLRIERRELHGQMVDVAVYGPQVECAPIGWIYGRPLKFRQAENPPHRSMNGRFFAQVLLEGRARGLDRIDRPHRDPRFFP